MDYKTFMSVTYARISEREILQEVNSLLDDADKIGLRSISDFPKFLDILDQCANLMNMARKKVRD